MDVYCNPIVVRTVRGDRYTTIFTCNDDEHYWGDIRVHVDPVATGIAITQEDGTTATIVINDEQREWLRSALAPVDDAETGATE